MSNQTVTFASDRYPELIAALTNALPAIEAKHEEGLSNRFDQYQKWVNSLSRFYRWLFVEDVYATLDEYRKSEDFAFVQHFHKELIKRIYSMIDMLTTSPPPDAITIDYDFWTKISRNQPKCATL